MKQTLTLKEAAELSRLTYLRAEAVRLVMRAKDAYLTDRIDCRLCPHGHDDCQEHA